MLDEEVMKRVLRREVELRSGEEKWRREVGKIS
jgi:hypothetical protein